jgi:lipoprotein-anchoring transpeptidase ErfK/SrfK
MSRKSSLVFALLLSPALPAFAETKVLKAVPVDPSDITPQGTANPAKPPAIVPPPEPPQAIRPLGPGEVKVPPWTPKSGSDSPILKGLPGTEDALRLQIFLDQSCFGPGIIDGKPGRFTILATQAWNEVHGHELNDLQPALEAARKAVPHPFARAVVPEIADKWVNVNLPTGPAQTTKAKRMSYRSIGEFMAERFHSDMDFIVQLNGAKTINNLKEGDTLIVPDVKPFLIEDLTGRRYDAQEPMSHRHAVVDTKMNQVRIFESAPKALIVQEGPDEPATVRQNEGLIASFPITPGQPQFIHYGEWELKASVELPVWRYDKSLLETGKRSSESVDVPPGPNNPVGIIWNGLSRPGIGMHGTPDPETIGRARSHGCIRLANWDAIRIPTLLRPGATVEIR